MPHTLKAGNRVELQDSLMGIRNLISRMFFQKAFAKGTRKQQRQICQTLAAGISLAMILPLALILYFVIQNFV